MIRTGKHKRDRSTNVSVVGLGSGSYLREAVKGPSFANVEQVIAALAQGRMTVVVNDARPEMGADLTMAAELCQTSDVAFMRRHTSGVICAPMAGGRLDQLRLPLISTADDAWQRRPFALSVDARDGITTGISAADRAWTLRLLADPKAHATDFVKPGHIFPLRAHEEGGVLARAARTNAAVDLCRLASMQPVAVASQITNVDGSISQGPELKRFARVHGLKLITVGELIVYRTAREQVVSRVATASLCTRHATFIAHSYRSRFDDSKTHIALVLGNVSESRPVLVHLHLECLGGDVFGSHECNCGAEVDAALTRISEEGRGVFVYIRRQTGVGAISDRGRVRCALGKVAHESAVRDLDWVRAREGELEYLVGVQVLIDLGVRRVSILASDPPSAVVSNSASTLKIVGWVPIARPIASPRKNRGSSGRRAPRAQTMR